MKTKNEKTKAFDAVKTFREIKEKISKDTYGMTFDQFKAYLVDQKQNTSQTKEAIADS